ncbi:MAG: hypothetical protein QGG50_00235 [Methanopyri archaeon]|nr:hypothetical protein [Methanopyri archaeon]
MKFIDLLIVLVVIALIVVVISNATGGSTYYYGSGRRRSRWSSVNVFHWGSSRSSGTRSRGYSATSSGGSGIK